MPAPYSPATWKKISACGDATEAELARSGVLLTMGGEPTFIPLAPEGAEWSVAALGPTKLALARRFARQLITDHRPGAVVLETSGKHYPGEPLPRWALNSLRQPPAGQHRPRCVHTTFGIQCPHTMLATCPH